MTKCWCEPNLWLDHMNKCCGWTGFSWLRIWSSESSTVNMINTFGLHNLTPQNRVILKKSMAADKVHRYFQSHKAHFVSCSRNTRQGSNEPAKSTSMCNFVTSCLWRCGVVIPPFNTQGGGLSFTGTPNFPSDKKKCPPLPYWKPAVLTFLWLVYWRQTLIGNYEIEVYK